MKVLVTGGAGFIGSHIVDALLAKQHDVIVVDNLYSGRKKNLTKEVPVIEADISEAAFWQKAPQVDSLFHISAQTSVTTSVTDSERDFGWNVQAAQNIFQWIKKNPVKQLLYANTAGALYGVSQNIPTGEDTPIRPICPYGATKSFFEIYIGALAESLYADGTWSKNPKDKNYFSWTSLRLGNVYGPRQITKGEAGVVPIFIEKFLKKSAPTIFGSEIITRDYVYVGDVANAFMSALEKLQQQPVNMGFNIASGKETRTGDLFRYVQAAMLEEGVEGIADLSPTIQKLRAGELERSCLDVSRAEKFLSWKPQMDIKQGIIQTVKHYLKNEN